MSKRNKLNLWVDAPCSLNYVTPSLYINKTPRFEIGSIYYKDEVTKSKRGFTEIERP